MAGERSPGRLAKELATTILSPKTHCIPLDGPVRASKLIKSPRKGWQGSPVTGRVAENIFLFH